MSFRQKMRLDEHLAHHSNEKAYPCKHCDSAFSTQTEYMRHMHDKHPQMNAKVAKRWDNHKTVCTVCAKEIVHNRISVHMRTHAAIRPHKCPHCPIRFTQKSNLNNHLRRHIGCKPYQCEHCDRTFHSASTLHGHKRCAHQLIELIRCELCNNLFTSEQSLLEHCNTQHSYEIVQTLSKQLEQFEL